jgi:hypothetical protein
MYHCCLHFAICLNISVFKLTNGYYWCIINIMMTTTRLIFFLSVKTNHNLKYNLKYNQHILQLYSILVIRAESILFSIYLKEQLKMLLKNQMKYLYLLTRDRAWSGCTLCSSKQTCCNLTKCLTNHLFIFVMPSRISHSKWVWMLCESSDYAHAMFTTHLVYV